MSKFVYLLILIIPTIGHGFEYKPTQAYSRGGTTLTFKNNYTNQILNNPSLLSDNDRFFLEINATADLSSDSLELIKNQPELVPGQYESTLDPYFGTYNRANAYGSGAIGYKNFALLPYMKSGNAEINLTNKVFPEAFYSLIIDTSHYLAYGQKVNKNLSLGASVGLVKREIQEGTAEALNFDAGIKENKTSSEVINSNLSLNYNFLNKLNSSAHFSILNLNNPKFTDDNVIGSWGGELKRKYNMGFKSEYKDFSLGVELQDMFSSTLLANKTHLGLEYKLSDYFSLSTGLNQGYLSYGANLKIWRVMEINFASYELNRYQFYRSSSRQYSINISLGWL